jgi:DNA-directed RNA polymerase specialized sigma24 family protein
MRQKIGGYKGMTYEKMKGKLEQIRRRKYYDQRMQEKVREMLLKFETLYCPIGLRITQANPLGVRVQTSDARNSIDLEYEKFEAEIKAEREKCIIESKEFEESVEEVEIALRSLPMEEKAIIEDYYIRNISANRLAAQMHYDVRTIYRKIQRGIRMLVQNANLSQMSQKVC